MSDSVRPHRRQPTRLRRPWDSPGKNTGVGCHYLLQRIFPAQGLNWGLLHCKQILYQLSYEGNPKLLVNGTPLQYSRLENPMDGGGWCTAVHGVTKSWTRLSDFTLTFHFHAFEKEMATHSSVLAWRISGTGEPGGLLSMGLHRVGQDRSNLAAGLAASSFNNLAHKHFRQTIFLRVASDMNIFQHIDP